VDTLRPTTGSTERLTVMIWTAQRLTETSESRR